MSPTNTARRQFGRRRLLAAGTAAATVGLAGCTRAVNYSVDPALEDVNLFNGTDQQLSGSITITDPEESTALDEEFAVEPDDDRDDDDIDGDSSSFSKPRS